MKAVGFTVTLEMVKIVRTSSVGSSMPLPIISIGDTSKGFNDPNGVYPKYKDEVDTIVGVNLKSGTTETNPHLSLTLRRSTRITGVATSGF